MNDVVVSVKLPREVFEILEVEVGRGKRSEFIRQAIMEKLSSPSKGESIIRKLEELEERISRLEKILPLKEHNDVNVHPLYSICKDENERKIIEYILKEGGATTRELEKVVGLKRRQILNRMRGLAFRAEKELGKPMLVYVRPSVKGKRQAWWINDNYR